MHQVTEAFGWTAVEYRPEPLECEEPKRYRHMVVMRKCGTDKETTLIFDLDTERFCEVCDEAKLRCGDGVWALVEWDPKDREFPEHDLF